MELLSEDPTYLAGGLVLLSLGLLAALKVSHQGKYLIWAVAVLALALAVVVIERLWITDNERIEQMVSDLRHAVATSDVEGVLSRLTPDVEYVQGGRSVSGDATRRYIRSVLGKARFEFLQIIKLRTNAGRQSRLGSAEFRVRAGGSFQTSGTDLNFVTTGSDWSLGVQETSPGTWKVFRISPLQLPRGVIGPSS